MKIAIGKKVKMTQLFQDDGKQIPVTKIRIVPVEVSQIRTENKDGYEAVQLSSANGDNCQEFRVLSQDQLKLKVGDKLGLDEIKDAKKVSVTGFSKGKGFQGAIKRHGFSRGPMSHGGNHHRKTGAIGQCVMPSRVFKNKKMPGQMGNTKISIKNLEVVKSEENYLFLKGSVPGPNGNYITIRE
jgi:large subunit ribosomal protein L3